MAVTQYEMMTQTPVPRLVLRLCGPTIVSMLTTNLYNMADTYFVSQMGISASGAIGIVFSLMSIIQAIGFMLGQGSGVSVSRLLGQRRPEDASRFASAGFFLALTGGGVLALAGLSCLTPLIRFLGSTETILPWARSYGRYILAAAPLMASSCVLNNLLRYEGQALLAMCGLGFGAFLNIVLDPLFIFGLGMGMDGAGLATALSQCVSFSILLYMILSGRTQCRLSLRRIACSRDELLQIFKNGMPSMARQGLNSVSTMLINRQANLYGDIAVAAISIVLRICNFLTSLMIGIGQGMQPVAGFNYSVGKYKRVRQAFRFTALLGEAALGSLAIICFFFTDAILIHFKLEASALEMAAWTFRLQSLGLLFRPLAGCANMLFQSIGLSGRATVLSALRSGLLLIPLLYFMTYFWGIDGLLAVQAVSDVLTFIISLPLLIGFFLKLPQEAESDMHSDMKQTRQSTK